MPAPRLAGGQEGRPPLLFLCHRIPYPPNKGDKIRSYHLLQYLRDRFRVYLGTFVDDPADWEHGKRLEALCEQACILPLHPLRARLRSLPSLVSDRALSVTYYSSGRMRKWVAQTCSEASIRHVIAFSSPMAQYLTIPALAEATKVVDFVDVDSDKWAQYSETRPAWEAWVYRREARRLAAFECAVARRVTAATFVSDAEVALFRSRLGSGAATVRAMPNGVDTGYFQPDPALPSPPEALPGEEAIVFTGAMDYWANVDAVQWFAAEILPRVVAERPRARFYIVGTNPGPEVRSLAGEHVVVTGRVPDVRPYLQHAHVVAAPMRIARGIQNKVLEGMAMAKVVVTTDKGLEGLNVRRGSEVLTVTDPEGFARLVTKAIADPDPAITHAARRRVVESYAWDAALAPLEALLS